jgi:hypothetical protein
MTLFSEKIFISNTYISGLMPNLIKKIMDGLYLASMAIKKNQNPGGCFGATS